jgi:hypothetical protein
MWESIIQGWFTSAGETGDNPETIRDIAYEINDKDNNMLVHVDENSPALNDLWQGESYGEDYDNLIGGMND